LDEVFDLILDIAFGRDMQREKSFQGQAHLDFAEGSSSSLP